MSKTLSHSTVTELKTAGFPDPAWGEGRPCYKSDTEIFGELVIPSLAELLTACGSEFGRLERHESGRWGASMFDRQCINGSGATPEEAVAHLWLAMQKLQSPALYDSTLYFPADIPAVL